MEPWTAFWLFCAAVVVGRYAPRIIRAAAEARCQHSWEFERKGDVVANMGEIDEKKVGYYSLYRCTICGAERDYR